MRVDVYTVGFSAYEAAMSLVVAADSFVTIRYTVFAEGSQEPVDDGEAVQVDYVHGYGQVLPALEKGIAGLAAGEKCSVHASAEDAFGPHEEDGIFALDRENLEGLESVSVGDEVVASSPDGEIMMRVLEVRDDALLVDTNHPLAGKSVRFDVEVVSVREATEEEIAEAEADLEDDGCGCGHDHSHDDADGHDHGEGHDHDHGEPLVKLRISKLS